jgi:hypothetical protein
VDIQTLHKEFGENAQVVLSNVVPIAESYLDACDVLGLEIEDAENAILSVAKQYGGCVRCRHSRAVRGAEEYARKRGALPVTMRTCVLGLCQDTCQARESIIPD